MPGSDNSRQREWGTGRDRLAGGQAHLECSRESVWSGYWPPLTLAFRPSAPVGNGLTNSFSHVHGLLVGPKPEDQPTCCLQQRCGLDVPRTVGFYFEAPEVCIGVWPSVVLRAAVPEATVDKDSNLGAGEYEVC